MPESARAQALALLEEELQFKYHAAQIPSKPLRLSRARALALLEELLAGYRKPAFQDRLAKLMSKGGRVSNGFHVLGREELAFTVQKAVLRRYGFEPSLKGLMEMVHEIDLFQSDVEISMCRQAINKCLKVSQRTDSKKATEDENGRCEVPNVLSCETTLSRTGAHAMMNELLARFGRPHFQQRLAKLVTSGKAHVSKDGMFVLGRSKVAQTVSQEVLPRYGFAANDAGVKAAAEEIERLASCCPEIAECCLALCSCLKPPARPFIELGADTASFAQRCRELEQFEHVRCWSSPHSPRLSRAQVHSLMVELHREYNSPMFQRQRTALMGRLGTVSKHYVDIDAWRLLMLSAQCKVLPSYGFEANYSGVQAMADELDSFLACREIFECAVVINQCLKIPMSTYTEEGISSEICKGATEPFRWFRRADTMDPRKIEEVADHKQETTEDCVAVSTQIELAPEPALEEPVGSFDSLCKPKLSRKKVTKPFGCNHNKDTTDPSSIEVVAEHMQETTEDCKPIKRQNILAPQLALDRPLWPRSLITQIELAPEPALEEPVGSFDSPCKPKLSREEVTKPFGCDHNRDTTDPSSREVVAEHMQETTEDCELIKRQIILAPQLALEEPVGSLDSPCKPELSREEVTKSFGCDHSTGTTDPSSIEAVAEHMQETTENCEAIDMEIILAPEIALEEPVGSRDSPWKPKLLREEVTKPFGCDHNTDTTDPSSKEALAEHMQETTEYCEAINTQIILSPELALEELVGSRDSVWKPKLSREEVTKPFGCDHETDTTDPSSIEALPEHMQETAEDCEAINTDITLALEIALEELVGSCDSLWKPKLSREEITKPFGCDHNTDATDPSSIEALPEHMQETTEDCEAINMDITLALEIALEELVGSHDSLWKPKLLHEEVTKPFGCDHNTDTTDLSSIEAVARHLQETAEDSEAINTQIKLAPELALAEPVGSLDSPCKPKLSRDRAHALASLAAKTARASHNLDKLCVYQGPSFKAELAKQKAQMNDLTFRVLRDVRLRYDVQSDDYGFSDVARECDVFKGFFNCVSIVF